MGISGCLAFLLILTSRRDELATPPGRLRGAAGPGQAGAVRRQGDLGGDPADRALRDGRRRIWEILERRPRQARLRPPRIWPAGATAGRSSRSTAPARGPVAGPPALSGPIGHFPTVQWAGPAPDRLAPPGRGLDAGGRHRVPVPAAALAGHGRAAGAAVLGGPTERRGRSTESPAVAGRADPVAADGPRSSRRRPRRRGPGPRLVPSPSARPPMGWLRDRPGLVLGPVAPARSLGEE